MPEAVATIAGSGAIEDRAPASRAARSLFLRDMVRYGLCSVAALALDWGVLVLLVRTCLAPQIAAATGFLLGMALNYGLSIGLVFSDRRRDPPLKEAALFAAIGLAGLCLNQAAIWILSDRFGMDPVLAKAPTVVLVFFFNFCLRRAMLFSQPQP